MPDRRAPRFVLEVLFLVALATALTIADLRPLVIAGVMLLGWVIVALLEWASWRNEPHFGSGLPPRYYVPQVSLPPRRPLEQVSPGYPAGRREEAPTWIASPALRSEVLGEWPVPAPAAGEETQDDLPQRAEDEEEVVAAALKEAEADEADEAPVVAEEPVPDPQPEPERELPSAAEQVDGEPEPSPEPEPDEELPPAAEHVEGEPVEAEPEPEHEPEPEPVSLPVAADEERDAQAVATAARRRWRLWDRRRDGASPEEGEEPSDPWLVSELPVEPDEPVDVLEPGHPDHVPADAPVVALAAPRQQPTARHSLDPLAEPVSRRWLWKRGEDDDLSVTEVPARPTGVRVLPGGSERDV